MRGHQEAKPSASQGFSNLVYERGVVMCRGANIWVRVRVTVLYCTSTTDFSKLDIIFCGEET
jgi:hypothetical protein